MEDCGLPPGVAHMHAALPALALYASVLALYLCTLYPGVPGGDRCAGSG